MPRATIAEFKSWLHRTIESVEEVKAYPERDLSHYDGCAMVVREAGRRARQVGGQVLCELCRVRQFISPEETLDVLGACLAWCVGSGERSQLLTVGEVAQLLGVSVRTVWRRRSAGEIPEPIQVGGLTKWRREDIEVFVNG